VTVAVERSRQVALSAILLTVLAGVLWLLGWLAAKVSLAALWMVAAVGLGWSDGHTPRRD
jgi:hypothetical protein